jgi:flagellar motor switch protein FliG
MKKHQSTDYLRDHDLTIEEVKACAMFRHLSDAEAEEVIAALKTFTKIVYDYYKKEQQKL